MTKPLHILVIKVNGTVYRYGWDYYDAVTAWLDEHPTAVVESWKCDGDEVGHNRNTGYGKE